MRHLLTSLLAALVAVVLFTGPASAQSYLLSNTTLNGAITAAQPTLVLTSASASTGSSFGAPAAGQCLYVDNELMTIVSTSSTTMTVRRPVTGGAGPHATSAVVITGPCNAFFEADPPNIGANQTCSSQPAPWVNVKTADVWWCDLVSNKWTVTNPITRNGTAGSRRVAQ